MVGPQSSIGPFGVKPPISRDGLQRPGGTGLRQASMAQAAGIQRLVEALQQLSDGQRTTGFSKHVKTPEVFKPETRAEELAKWQDWRFAFENFIGVIDNDVLREMKQIVTRAAPLSMAEMAQEEQTRSERLYAMLSTQLRNRPQRLVRGVVDQNGYEAWRILVQDMQPATRQRGLALIQSLNKVKFEANRSITEQLPQFELMVKEYERTSNHVYPDDLKVASVVSALPAQMRMHVQMYIDENTTFDDVKARIALIEQLSTTWTADSNLQMPTSNTQHEDDGGTAPMEVDLVWHKGGKRGKDGKGKKGYKGGKDKGKGYKGKGFQGVQQKGKDKGKKGGGKYDNSGKGKECCFATTAGNQVTRPRNVGAQRR